MEKVMSHDMVVKYGSPFPDWSALEQPGIEQPEAKSEEAATKCPTCAAPTIGGRATEWWLGKLKRITKPEDIEMVAAMLTKFAAMEKPSD
jgi:hypothetical protein